LFLILLSLLVAAVVTVSAAGTIDSVSGPDWDGSNYQWTVEVSQLSNPDKYICLDYVATGSNAQSGNILCACANPDPTDGCVNATGQWICTLGAIPDATINWEVDCFTSASENVCGGETDCSGSSSGEFQTGPTAVSLSSFTASTLFSAAVPWLLGAGTLLLAVIILVWSRQR
jgi:hypothetical protein